jgi:hypothetical protein
MEREPSSPVLEPSRKPLQHRGVDVLAVELPRRERGPRLEEGGRLVRRGPPVEELPTQSRKSTTLALVTGAVRAHPLADVGCGEV